MISRLLIMFVRAYQVVLAPLIGPCCRFTPSCSEYCIGAITIHGPWRGTWLTVRRLLRCRPFGPCGYDPVPLRHNNGSPAGITNK
ncbi:MAG: membrane protein insertion efficiency factor YidD [Lentisphaerae bacterium]|jgi:putative membrane protein insertion efficiency factor|nr:membrane protein insertion efficiency factor YidD [Lentisphaerota bacterium]